jgi:hypothetical protein
MPGSPTPNTSGDGAWALFRDYCAATGQTALPATAATLERFFTTVPVRPATRDRRLRAIVAAHRHAGYDTGFMRAATKPAAHRHSRLADAGAMIAACPTGGWPTGFTGRRDGFLVVLIEILGHTQRQASRLTPTSITPAPDGLLIDTAAIPTSDDARACPACATVRWLEVCDLADGLGHAIARELLSTAPVPTATSTHIHLPRHQPSAGARFPAWSPASTNTAGSVRHGP